MKVNVQVHGLGKLIARLDKIGQAFARVPVGEVYIDGPRAEVAAVHAQGTDRMPARNPFFLDRAQTAAVRRRLAQGVKEINDGLSSGMRQTMSDAAAMGADAMRDNLTRQRHSPWRADPATPGRMAPLSKKYAERKRLAFGTKGILQATGELLDSISSRIKE